MSDMIRRKQAVPVQARRVEPQAETIQVPGAGPIPLPPAQPNVTQNIIYVNVPPQQQAPPQPPGEIHIHAHVHEYPKRRRGGRYGTSFLGTLGFVLGAIDCGLTYVPQLLPISRYIAMVAGGCAMLGLLNAMLFRRIGRGMPAMGVLASAAAYGFWMLNSGQLPTWLDFLKPSASPVPAVRSPSPLTQAPPQTGSPSIPSTPDAPKQKPAAPPRRRDPSIFGTDNPGWGNSQSTPAPPANPPVVPANPAQVAPVAPTLDTKTATENLEAVRLAAAKKLGVDYAMVKATAATAKSEYDLVSQTSTPGSPELINASRQRMQADTKLHQLQETLAKADPEVAAAEAALKTAKAAGR